MPPFTNRKSGPTPFTQAEVDTLLNEGFDQGGIERLYHQGWGGRVQEMLAQQRSGPPMGEENVRARLLGMVPPIAATAMGAIAGLRGGGARGVAGSAGAGQVAGRGIENLGRRAMGLPQRESMMERVAESSGSMMPPWVAGMMDMTEQGLQGAALEGVPAKMFGIPGKTTGAVGDWAHGKSLGMKTRAADRNVAQRGVVRTAERVPLSELEREAMTAAGERAAAGAAKEATLAQAKGEITRGEIYKRVRAKFAAGPLKKAPDRGRLQKEVDKVMTDIIEKAGHGAISGKKTVFNLREGDWAKTTFDRASRMAHDKSSGGIGHDPDLVEMISNAWREAIEERIPTIPGLNAEYHQARLADISARKARSAATNPGKVRTQAMRDAAEDRAIRVATMQPGKEGVLDPSIGMGGVWFHPPRMSTLLERSSEILNKPKVQGSGRYSGSLLNLLLHATEPDWNDELQR